jgi:hypothetical protein
MKKYVAAIVCAVLATCGAASGSDCNDYTTCWICGKKICFPEPSIKFINCKFAQDDNEANFIRIPKYPVHQLTATMFNDLWVCDDCWTKHQEKFNIAVRQAAIDYICQNKTVKDDSCPQPQRTINESKTQCPFCKIPTDRTIVSSSSTLMAIWVTFKADGTTEYYNPNKTTTTYKCLKCGKEFEVKE